MGLGVCRKRFAAVVDEVLCGEVYECQAPAHDELVIKYVFDEWFVMGGRRTFINFATQHFVYNCDETLPAHSQSHKESFR